MADNAVIKFADNNPDGIFYAGQVMTGSVTLQYRQTQGVNAVVLRIKGYAHTEWSDGDSTYSGHEDYMDSVLYLMGGSKNPKNASNNMKPGTYNYTFEYQIPLACPTSLESKIGHIRYEVTVKLVRPWDFDYKFRRNFTVLNVTDLRCDNPLFYLLAKVESSKTYSSLQPFKNNSLKMTISIPQTGYAPGQTIPVDLLINNESKVHIDMFKLSLIMDICYYTQKAKSNYLKKFILTTITTRVSVSAHSTKNFQLELSIPATPTTCVNLCSIIKITYKLEVDAISRGLYNNHSSAIPIKIIYLLPTTKLAELTGEKNDHMEASGSNSSVDRNSTFSFQAKLLDTLEGDVQQVEQGCSSHRELPPPSFAEAMAQNSAHALTAVSSKQLSGCTDTAPPAFEEAIAQSLVYDCAIALSQIVIQAPPPSKFQEALHLKAKKILSPNILFMKI